MKDAAGGQQHDLASFGEGFLLICRALAIYPGSPQPKVAVLEASLREQYGICVK